MNQPNKELRQQTPSPALAVIFLPGLFLLATSTFYPFDFLPVFDAKRILQLVLFAVLLTFATAWAPLRTAIFAQLDRVKRRDAAILFVFFAIGLVSALRLVHPAYPLLDVSMMLVLLVMVFITAAARDLASARFDRWAVLLLAVLGFAVFIQESMGILVGWVTGVEFSYKQALVHFAHPRFYNHLQTWSIPLLAALPLLFSERRGIKLICILLLGLQWFLVILTAARGTTVGLVTAMVFVAIWLPAQRQFWLRYQIAGLLTALAIYAGIFFLNTIFIPQSGNFYANSVGRPMMHTSGRSFLWRLAIEDGLSNPVIGSGPTQYACDIERHLPSHPHSFPFRIMGEWGIVAFVLLLLLASGVAVSLLKRLKSMSESGQTGPPLRAMLATSLIAGAIHACLSGVLIMPASQVAMILIAGWTLSLTNPHVQAGGKFPGKPLILATGLLVAVAQLTFAAFEIPNLHERTAYADAYGAMVPRIWQEGRVCEYSYSDFDAN